MPRNVFKKDAAGLTEQKNLCPENATGDINQNVDEKPKIVDDLIDLETQPSENKEDINKNTDKDYEVEKSAEKRTDKASVQSDSCDDNFGAMLKGETNVEGAFPLNAALGEKPATATEEVTAVTSVQGKLCISLKENTEIK
ncbi:hypothetical protein NQ318_007919 [Aromia moschata]|uniref:Uncharacterized protein n=1 Tax=Aromia moschata TaxID=1265417 RepID=A0AAV8XZW3_9CUCU|nr:hypothetical protein NQ318_007919 [Aromia moschata]